MAVRLVQGEAGTETTHGTPLDAALAWQDGGAEWIHLVDLDAALGRGSNAELLEAVIEKLDVKAELSGGIRDDASLEWALSTGCSRVILGTAALEDPAWCAEAIAAHGERIAVALDVCIVEGLDGSVQHRLATRGWNRDGGDLWETLAWLDRDGCARYVVTDVSRDGTLRGPQRGALPGRDPRHPGPGDRLRWDLHDRGSGCLGRDRRSRHEPGGVDRRQGALRRPVHASRGAAGHAARHPTPTLTRSPLASSSGDRQSIRCSPVATSPGVSPDVPRRVSPGGNWLLDAARVNVGGLAHDQGRTLTAN